MADFSNRPDKQIEIRVPNKIRKRIAMHETESSFLERLEATTLLRKVRSLPTVPVIKKRGSLWSRFTGGIAKMLQIKPTGVRK